jgi:hypothetical protein
MKKLISIYFLLFYNLFFAQNEVTYNNEIIVRINPKYLRKDVLENPQNQVFLLHQILTNPGQTLVNQMNVPGLINKQTKKAFPLLTWKDSISKTIDGREIANPPFWATFVIKEPNENKVCSTLRKLREKPEIIDFAHPNYPVEMASTPNDPLYARQESLNGSITIPFAGINVEEAWEIETGEPSLRLVSLTLE